MKNDFVPDDYKKISESTNLKIYEVKSDDRFIEFIYKRYNIKLCLCVDKHNIKSHYMCMCHYDGLDVDDYIMHHSTFSRSVVIFKDKDNQFYTPFVYFLNKYDSFRLNIAECIDSFKLKMIDAISRGFNILTVCYSNDESFGTIPWGSSENEIMMKMELMG